MKTLIAFVVIVCGSSMVFADSALEKSEAYYKKGLAAEKAGDPDAAAAAYKAALQLNPNNAGARYKAGEVKLNAGAIKSSATEAKIGAVKIPVYQLEDSTVSEAISVLATAIEKETGGEIVPNFVIEDPQGKLADIRITMQLKNVPVKAILDYIHSQAGTRARYDEHAVVIQKR